MAATDQLRWGILGVAKINDRLLPAFAKARNADVVAIASRSGDRALAAAKAAGIPGVHGSYESLLADSQVQAVYIPLPNTLHGEWVRKAADAGKHVLCEKPLCPTAAETRAVVDYCRAKGVKLMDGFMWPHHPRTARMKQVIDAGTIGPVKRVVTTFTFRLALDAGNIRLQSELAGGSLLDVGCYPVYGIRWAFGAEPMAARATAQYLHGCDVAMSGTLLYANGREGVFDCGFHLPMRQWFEVVGETGVLRVSDLWLPADPAKYELHLDGSEPETHTMIAADQIQWMIEDFGEAVLAGREPGASAEEAVKSLAVMDALAVSAKQGGKEVAVAAG